jgi:L-methionine (R)-S-oxide reductase
MNKAGRYERIFHQISGLMTTCSDKKARMATVCAVLHHKLPYFFWTGFYLLQDDRLIVAVYQGPVACMELEKGRGVCWKGILDDKPVVVPEVSLFEGHIACDSRSRSEMVVPVHDSGGKVLGVLDIDSTQPDAFDGTDVHWLERIVALIHDE